MATKTKTKTRAKTKTAASAYPTVNTKDRGHTTGTGAGYVEVYKSPQSKRYYWRRRGRNSSVVCISARGFTRQRYAAFSARGDNPGLEIRLLR